MSEGWWDPSRKITMVAVANREGGDAAGTIWSAVEAAWTAAARR